MKIEQKNNLQLDRAALKFPDKVKESDYLCLDALRQCHNYKPHSTMHVRYFVMYKLEVMSESSPIKSIITNVCR